MVFAAVELFEFVTKQYPNPFLGLAKGLDALLLTFIVYELLNTVLTRAPAAQRLREFLVIGVMSAVRYGLEIIAGIRIPGTAVDAIARAEPRETVISIAINALGILLLVAALALVRRFADPVSRSGPAG